MAWSKGYTSKVFGYVSIWSQMIADWKLQIYKRFILLRSLTTLWLSADKFDQLWSCDHMETKLRRCAIERHPMKLWGSQDHWISQHPIGLAKHVKQSAIRTQRMPSACLYNQNSEHLKIKAKKKKKSNNWEEIRDIYCSCEVEIQQLQKILYRKKMLPLASWWYPVHRQFYNLDLLKPRIAHRPYSW